MAAPMASLAAEPSLRVTKRPARTRSAPVHPGRQVVIGYAASLRPNARSFECFRDHRARFLLHSAQVITPQETLRINLIDGFRSRWPRREPAVLRSHF